MKTKSKLIIGIGSAIVVSGIGYLLIIRKRNKRELQAILDYSQGGEGSEIVESGKIVAFDPLFWKSGGKGGVVASFGTKAKSYAQQIKKMIGSSYTLSDEDGLLALFRQFNSQQQISLVTDFYYQLYKKDLATDLKTIDQSLFGLGSSNDAAKIFNMVAKLPKY